MCDVSGTGGSTSSDGPGTQAPRRVRLLPPPEIPPPLIPLQTIMRLIHGSEPGTPGEGTKRKIFSYRT